MLSSIVLATVIAGVLGQSSLPKPCTYPIQFTAQARGMNYEKNLMERAEVVYDGSGEMLFEKEQFRSADGHSGASYEVLYHFKTKNYWKVDQANRECYGPIKLTGFEKFSPLGVPKNSSFRGSATAGVYPTTLPLHMFGESVVMSDRSSYRSQHVVTVEECMPVFTEVFYTGVTGNVVPTNSSSVRYYNAVLGVEDPNVFIPPSNCRPASELPK